MMTISVNTTKLTYLGNGTATTYTVNSYAGDVLTGIIVFNASEVVVSLNGVVLTQGVHYNVTADASPPLFQGKLVNARVVFVTAPIAYSQIIITRAVSPQQGLQLSLGNQIPQKALESQLDKLTVMVQELQAQDKLTLRLPPEKVVATDLLNLTQANTGYLGWQNGNIVNKSPVDVGVDIEDATVELVDAIAYEPFTFSGDKVFYGGTVINGTLVVNNDATLGVITGNPTFTGNPTLSSSTAITATSLSTRAFALGDSIRGSAPTWGGNTSINMPALNCLDSTRTVYIACNAATLNLATTGLNGLDTGSLVANTWYYIWAILNPTTLATGFLASTSSTVPTMPSGFTVRRLVTALKTQASVAGMELFNFRTAIGQDQEIQYVNDAAHNTVVSGTVGLTRTSVSLTSVVPDYVSSASFWVEMTRAASPSWCYMQIGNSLTDSAGTMACTMGIDIAGNTLWHGNAVDMTLSQRSFWYQVTRPTGSATINATVRVQAYRLRLP
jgi:hypothetical protein